MRQLKFFVLPLLAAGAIFAQADRGASSGTEQAITKSR
jgi:hypothetical protein